MKKLLLLALIPALVAASYSWPIRLEDRSKERFRVDTGGSGFTFIPPSAATFLFAPAGGAGMGSVCACSAVTGSNGETVTLSRASEMTCLKHSETAGIVAGDMVTCANNQPVVQPGGDGGSGILGLSSWPARTNNITFPKQFDQWTVFGDFNPVVTADQALSPTNAMEADEVVFHSTASGQGSIIYELVGCPVGQDTLSVFVKGKSGSGTFDMAVDNATDGWLVGQCSYVSGSYTRCVMGPIGVTSSTSLLTAFGNMTNNNGGTTRSTNDVYMWGAQCEIGPTASPYIPSYDGGTATRAAQVASVSYSSAGAAISMAGTYAPLSLTNDFTATVSLSSDGGNAVTLGVIGAKDVCTYRTAKSDIVSFGPSTFLSPADSVGVCEYSSGVRTACADGYCIGDAGSLTLDQSPALVLLGSQFDGGAAEGTIKSVCLDPDAVKCQPAETAVACPSTEASTVALVGDSIMVGAFNVQVVEEMRLRLCPTTGAVSFAASGATISDCVDQYHNNVKGHAYKDVVTNCGINTLNIAGNVAASWAAMESFLNDVTQDGGFHVVVGNLTPCGGYSGCGFNDPNKVALFNANEANWCADAGSRATCVDNYTLLGSSSQTYTGVSANRLGNRCLPSSDSLHPNNYCTSKLADSFSSAIP